jgi:hypothetical protein
MTISRPAAGGLTAGAGGDGFAHADAGDVEGFSSQILCQSASGPTRVDVKVNPIRKQKSQSGDPDDKVQKMSFRIDIKNQASTNAINSAKAVIVAFASDMQDREEMIVLTREEFDVSLDPLKSESFETKQTKIVYDNVGYKYGHKYAGYIFVLKDASGVTLKIDASTPGLTKYAEAGLKLKAEDVCDRKLEFVKKGYLRLNPDHAIEDVQRGGALVRPRD